MIYLHIYAWECEQENAISDAGSKKNEERWKIIVKIWPGSGLQDVFIIENMLLDFVINTYRTILEWKSAVKICKIETKFLFGFPPQNASDQYLLHL